MATIHENQVGEVLSYQYEPEVGEKQAIDFNFGIGNRTSTCVLDFWFVFYLYLFI